MVSTSAANKKGQKKKQAQLGTLDKQTTRNEDYLNSILPPREHTDGGCLYVRYVSADPASKVDVMKLQEELDKRLLERGARDTGICATREELFS